MKYFMFICVLICSAAVAEECPPEVRVVFSNFEIAPFIYGAEKMESPPGLAAEWANNAIIKTGCQSKITMSRRPSKRLVAEMSAGLQDIAPGFAYAPQRHDDLVFPMLDGEVNADLVLNRNFISLYARADDQSVKWDGQRLQANNPAVGISAGTPLMQMVAEGHQWKVDVANNPSGNLAKLSAARIDVFMEMDMIISPYLTGNVAKNVRKLSPPVQVINHYAPASKQFQQTYPEFTRRFWLEMCKESRATFPALPKCH